MIQTSSISYFKVCLFISYLFLSTYSLAHTGPETAGPDTNKDQVEVRLKLLNQDIEMDSFQILDKEIEFLLSYWNITGASLAIVNQGNLVYTRGYGYADRANKVDVQPNHLFRIASVSKLITATAIFKLVEQGMLNLSDQVFGPNGWLTDSIYQAQIGDERVYHITVKDLLNHSGGWSRRESGDPLFLPIEILYELYGNHFTPAQMVISYALSEPLDFNPGKESQYSNLGYLILGEIIARASGQPYEVFVKQQILQPLGIHDMEIGKNLAHQRYSDEVYYYDLPTAKLRKSLIGLDDLVPRPYGGTNVELLGPSGGWIASSIDLVKFVQGIDGFPEVPDILSETSINTMTDVLDEDILPMGWIGVNQNDDWWRTGTLAGTSALLIRKSSNLSYAIVTNSSSKLGNRFSTELYAAIERGLRKLEKLPEVNLFDQLDKTYTIPEKIAAKPAIETNLYDRLNALTRKDNSLLTINY